MQNEEITITRDEYFRLYSFINRYEKLVSHILRSVIDKIDNDNPDMEHIKKFDLIVETLTEMNLPFTWNKWNYPTSTTISADIEKMGDLKEDLLSDFQKELRLKGKDF
jgi:phage-related minor tail protein